MSLRSDDFIPMKKFQDARFENGTQLKFITQLLKSLSKPNVVYVNPFLLKSYPEDMFILHLGVNSTLDVNIKELLLKSF